MLSCEYSRLPFALATTCDIRRLSTCFVQSIPEVTFVRKTGFLRKEKCRLYHLIGNYGLPFQKKITVIFTLQFSCGYPARRGLRIESLIDKSSHCYQTKSECMYICHSFITNKIIVFFFIGNIL